MLGVLFKKRSDSFDGSEPLLVSHQDICSTIISEISELSFRFPENLRTDDTLDSIGMDSLEIMQLELVLSSRFHYDNLSLDRNMSISDIALRIKSFLDLSARKT